MNQFTELRCKVGKKSETYHSIFIRPHLVREKIPEKPPDLTLFVAGVPPFFNEETVRNIFRAFGEVNSVFIHKSPSPKLPEKDESNFFRNVDPVVGYKVAYVVFQTSLSVDSAMKHKDDVILSSDSFHTGFEKWAREYNASIPDPKELSKEIETYMLTYDKTNDRKKKKDKSGEGEDDEGWVTVSKKGRKPGFSRKESVKNQLQRISEESKKKKEHTNFYRFQIKESKMKNLVVLRQKFEEDKKKIAALKATRRFKPF